MPNDLIIPQLGGTNGKHYPFKKKVKKSAITSPQTGENPKGDNMSSDERGSPAEETVKQLFNDIAAAGDKPIEIGTPPAGPPEPDKTLPVVTAPPPPVAPPKAPETVKPKTETPTKKPDVTLVRILMWKRPHNTAGEQNFVTWLHKEIAARGGKVEVSKGGNVICEVPYPNKKGSKGATAKRTVLFSCHTDTVHHDCNGDQTIYFDAGTEHLFLDFKNDKSSGSCLGADDGAGIWLCLEMIRAKVPGTYVFHRGEEVGGVGSRALLANDPTFLQQFEIAIAFDRKGTGDVIVEQGAQVCASDKFGTALCLALNDGTGFDYRISRFGSFTDTKVYRSVIAECCNISVGYENAHSADETLDYGHLEALRDRLIKLNWDALPIDRDPTKADTTQYKRHIPDNNIPGWNGYKGRTSYPQDADFGLLPDDEVAADSYFNKNKGGGTGKPPLSSVPSKVLERAMVTMARSAMEPEILDELRSMSREEIDEVASDPEVAYSVIIALFAELEAAYAKVNVFRGLADLD